MTYTLDDALARLRSITNEEPVTMSGYFQIPMWFDNPVYTLSDGWSFEVFIDCDEWDYIEWIKTPDGTMFGWPEPGVGEVHDAFYWTPNELNARWGFPD